MGITLNKIKYRLNAEVQMNYIETNIDGEMILVEVSLGYGSANTSVGKQDEVAERAMDAFGKAKKVIHSVAQNLLETAQNVDRQIAPDEFQIEFAISFTMSGQVILAKVGAEANLKVTMTYKHDKLIKGEQK